MRSRGLLVALMLILIGACAGGYAAWRVARSRLAGESSRWEPPTVAAPEATPASTARILTTGTPKTEVDPTVASAQPSDAPTPEPPTPTAIPRESASPSSTRDVATATRPLTVPPTETSPAATATHRVDTAFTYVLRKPVSHTKDGCPGKYILGMITDQAGTPIAGVTVRAVDPWGNEATAQSKSAAGDAGHYDIPLYPPTGVAVTYRVQVLDENGTPMSATVEVAHGSTPNEDATCHWLDWQKVK